VRGSLVLKAVLLALVVTVTPPLGLVEVWANPVTLTETLEDLPVLADPSTSQVIETELTFNAVGVSAPRGTTAVYARTSLGGEDWTGWAELEFIDVEDGPDPGTAEAAGEDPAVSRGLATEALWVGEADHLQLQAVGAVASDLEVTIIDSMGSSGGPVERQVKTPHESAQAYGGITLISRAQWGADESWRSGTPKIANQVHMGVVHHTAHAVGDRANSYTQAEAPGIMRAMYSYHTKTLGWSDLGYNVVVDRFGNVYEGRAGGFDQAVIGAHASGFNTGSFGVSVMGDFRQVQAPAAAIASLTRVIGVKSAIHGIDPTGWTDRMGGATWRPTILGHKDVGSTACPGLIHTLLPQIRQNAAVIAAATPVTAPPPPDPYAAWFPDVPTSSYHRPAIISLAEAGVTSGCSQNLYCPAGQLNRAQASTFVVKALEMTPIPGSRFKDVPASGTHASAINALAQAGLLVGYDDGTFRPWEPMTRGQLATLLARAAGLPLTRPTVAPYPDVPVTATHAPGIAALASVGIYGDCGSGRYCPNDVVLRDSTATFVHRVRSLRP
jgi:hypothetical protein